MSIERELLEKVISGDNKGDFFISYDLYKEIHEFLAKPKREGLTPREGLTEYKKGYARAELDLKREPLSDKDIGKGFLLTDVWHRYECFIAGIKWAERQHGIGGGE